MPEFIVTAHTADNEEKAGVFPVTAADADAAINEICATHDLAPRTYTLRVYDTDNVCLATATLVVGRPLRPWG